MLAQKFRVLDHGRYCKSAQCSHHKYVLAELHTDLFRRYVSSLEVYVFVAVDERGKDVMFDEICRRCNGKQQGRKRGAEVRSSKTGL